MPIEALEGRIYGPRAYRICSEKVTEFVAATGDDSGRWRQAAPPGFAAALLFVVAPELLEDPAVDGAVVHGDQSFTWLAPLRLEAELDVSGVVERVRRRGTVAFVTFSLQASAGGEPVVEGRSTFLIGAEMSAATGHLEGDPTARGTIAGPTLDLPSPRSASRLDLIRYAAATRDWNPIHWDHHSAVAASLGGVVVHGLLQSAWLTQTAAMAGAGERPLEWGRVRYQAVLRPGEQARIEGEVGDQVDLRLLVDERVTVSGRFMVAS